MQKELAQSDLPSKRKVPNATQKYHIRGKWYFQMVFGTFLLLCKSQIELFIFSLVFSTDRLCMYHVYLWYLYSYILKDLIDGPGDLKLSSLQLQLPFSFHPGTLSKRKSGNFSQIRFQGVLGWQKVKISMPNVPLHIFIFCIPQKAH